MKNMNNAQRLKILTDSGKTVFSVGDIQSLWQSSALTTKISLKRMLDKNLVVRLAKGYYALHENYNIYELANTIITPSYISLDSALFYHQIAFQVSSCVSSVALLNYQKEIQEKTFIYYAMKEPLFFNLAGVEYKNNLAVALPERAILDGFYFGLLPNIDNFNKINASFLKELVVYYPDTVKGKLEKLLKTYDTI